MRSFSTSFKFQVSSFMLITAALLARAATWNPHFTYGGVFTNMPGVTMSSILTNNFLALENLLYSTTPPLVLDGAKIQAATVPAAAMAANSIVNASIVTDTIASNKLSKVGVWDAIGANYPTRGDLRDATNLIVNGQMVGATNAVMLSLIAATNSTVAKAGWARTAEYASNAVFSTVGDINGAADTTWTIRGGDKTGAGSGGSIILRGGNANWAATDAGSITIRGGIKTGMLPSDAHTTNSVYIYSLPTPTVPSQAVPKDYTDAISNAAYAAYVKKSGDTMSGLLTTPSNSITYAVAIGDMPIPTARGAQNAGGNIFGTVTASGDGAQNVGYNYHGIMEASGYGAQNIGLNCDRMEASGYGAQNAGENSGTMTASAQGSLNRGYLGSGQYCTNEGNGSIALLDGSGDMLITNHAAIVLGNGYSMGDRTLVADAVVIRSMGSRATDAATKGYVDGITNAFVSRAVAVTNTGDSIISRFTFVGGLLQSFTQESIP